MIVNVTYDTSVNGAPAGFKSAITYVVNFLQSNFTDPVTINVAVGWGEVDGQTVGLGESIRNLALQWRAGSGVFFRDPVDGCAHIIRGLLASRCAFLRDSAHHQDAM